MSSDDGWTSVLSSGAWVELDGSLKTCGTGAGGYIVGTNIADDIYVREGAGGAWAQIPGSLKQVDTKGPDMTVGANSAGNLYSMVGGAWTQLPGAGSHMAIGVDGSMFVVGTDNELYNLIDGNWVAVLHPAAARVSVVAAGSARDVWTLTNGGEIFRFDGASWTQVPGSLASIAVSGSGRVLGTNMHGSIYQFHRGRDAWLDVPGAATYAAISDDSAYVINSAGNIFHMALPSI